MTTRQIPPRSFSAYSYRSADEIDDSAMQEESSRRSSSVRSSMRRSSIRRCISDSSERASTTAGRNIERLMTGASCPSPSVDAMNRTRRESLRISRPKRLSLKVQLHQRQRRSFCGENADSPTDNTKENSSSGAKGDEWRMFREALQQLS